MHTKFEEEVRRVIRARHGVARVLRFGQVKAVLKAVNLPCSNDSVVKFIRAGVLVRVKKLPKGMKPHYRVEDVVRLVVQMSGEG